MNIGIIVHSKTGNTLSVAERLKEQLIKNGHQATVERVSAVNEDPKPQETTVLQMSPDVTPYDRLIFAAPVNAFSLSLVMRAYLAQLPELNGKRADIFVTQQFPHAWMGGNHTLKQMRSLLEAKGGKVYGEAVVNWSHKDREGKITAAIQTMSAGL